jgi:EF-P beta-lysylation protein EpmB
VPHLLNFAQSPQNDWEQILREAVRDIGELITLLELPPSALACLDRSTQEFPLLVPRGYLSRMRMGDPRDPLLLQVLPHAAESERPEGFGDDPLDERARSRSGLIQKYANRALLITTGACPVHCRYCFRRSFPYAKETASRSDWRPALTILEKSKETKEVILSGGDPLSLSNRRLSDLLLRLDALPHIETVRIHTRFPIMIPERVDDGLVELLTNNRFNVAIVIHTNHAREIDSSVAAALSRLRAPATALLNQSVLLRQVNDDSDTLCALSERLFECGVLPYYLHLLDPVSGTAHFEVDEGVGIELVKEMRANVPGYLVPTLVREIPGEPSKTPIQ